MGSCFNFLSADEFIGVGDAGLNSEIWELQFGKLNSLQFMTLIKFYIKILEIFRIKPRSD